MRNSMIFALTLTFATIPHAFACAQDTSGKSKKPDAKRVASNKHAFSVIPPVGWKRAAYSRSAFLEFVGPAAQKLPNVNVRAVAYDGGDLRELCAVIKSALEGGDDEWTPIYESFLEIDGHKAFFLIATQMNETQGIRFKTKMLQCFIGDKPNGYIMTFSCLPELFDELRPSFEKSANSVQLKQK